MNLWRLLRKCFTDPPAAVRSAKLAIRRFYGQSYWQFYPNQPLAYRLPTGGVLLLQPGHSFTDCFWPDIERCEPDVRGALQYLLKSGDIFIDCGANIGYFSLQAGGLVGVQGKVISIEANPLTYQLLKRNLKANNFGIPIHCALTSQTGEVELFMPSEGDIYSSLRKGGLVKGDSVSSFKVQGRSLDEVVKDLALSRVDVVKIDIEGAEIDVLRSAPHLLSTFRPVLIIEYGTNTWPIFEATPEDLKEITRQHHYALRLFNVDKQRFIPISEEVWQSHYTNLILFPEERLE